MVLFCHVTSWVETDPDQGLLQQTGGTGFPYLAFLDVNGNVIAKPRGRSVDAFAATLADQVSEWWALVDLAATGDADAGKQLLLQKIELGHFADVEQARAELGKIDGVSGAERQKAEQDLVGQEFSRILGTVKSIEDAGAAGALARPMLDKGRVPKSGSMPMYFWLFLGKHGEETGDVELLSKAVDGLGDLPRVPPVYMKPLQEALEKLQKKKG